MYIWSNYWLTSAIKLSLSLPNDVRDWEKTTTFNHKVQPLKGTSSLEGFCYILFLVKYYKNIFCGCYIVAFSTNLYSISTLKDL